MYRGGYYCSIYTSVWCKHMNSIFKVSKAAAILGGVALTGSMLPLAGNAVEIGDGQTVFEGYPLLTHTSQASVGMRERYEFTIDLPDNAGEALRTVTFQPVAGSSSVDFYSESANATVNDATVEIAAVTMNDDGSQLMEITFDEPVAPGSTVTIQVSGPRMSRGGPAMVGVLASADGANPLPYFMGCLPTNPETIDGN